MKKIVLTLLCVLMAVSAVAQKNVYGFKVKDANGHIVKLKNYKGKVMLIVNTATKCGFTPQYEALQKLYDTYKAQGLVVLDFPCNQFGAQAPGTLSEIRAFCIVKAIVEKYPTNALVFLRCSYGFPASYF